MPKHSSKKDRNPTEPFIAIKRWEFKCDARKALTGDEWLIYCDMRFSYNGRNNGAIAYSSRHAGRVIGKSHSTGSRALKRLAQLGFIKVTTSYGYDQKRMANEYELTAISLQPAKRGNRLPNGTMDFMKISQTDIDVMNAAREKAKAKAEPESQAKPPQKKDSVMGDADRFIPAITAQNIQNSGANNDLQ